MLELLNSVDYNTLLGYIVVIALSAIVIGSKSYIQELVSILIDKLKADAEAKGYERELKLAIDIWNRVDEDFRISEKIAEEYDSKANYFKELILKQFPNMSDEEIINIRQTVAGIMNKNKNLN